MDYNKSAIEIIKYIGGEENIVHLEHCSTRLRFTVKDKTLVQEAKLKSVLGVIGVILNAQVQVIIGNNVIEMYDAIMKIYHPKKEMVQSSEDKKWTTIVLEYIVGIFQPLVPAIAGAGVLKSVLVLLSTFGLVSTFEGLYTILLSISDATFYFLPLMVAITTATKLNTNKLVALVAAGVLILPTNVTLLTDGVSILGFTVKNVVYNSQVFPAILTVLFLGILEKYLNKVSPKAIRVFFVPMLALAITIPVTYLFLGPLGFTLGEYLTTAILFLYDKLGFVGMAILAGILPFMIATGMHKAMVPYAVSTYGKLGYEMMYLPASLAHNISESGACFAVALKAKDKQLKSVAASAGISALMGITEPALYGITLLHKKVLYSIVASSFITGGVVGFFGLKSFVVAGPGLANITMFIDSNNSYNLIYGILGFVLAFVLSFVFTYIIWKEVTIDKEENYLVLSSPIEGKQISLEEVKDSMFSTKTLGDGVAFLPKTGYVYAPCDATVKMIFETKHALGLETSNHKEILFHIGLETVNLKGKYFTTHVEAGQKVKKGDVLVSFDLNKIKELGYDTTTMMIFTSTCKFKNYHKQNVTKNDTIITIESEDK